MGKPRQIGQQILKLRQEGKTYDEIQNILNCSKGAISYHCGLNQKTKKKIRQKRNRSKNHPLQSKIENFIQRKQKEQTNLKYTKPIQTIILLKISRFKKSGNTMSNITLEDVLNKIGNEPKCYLTGLPIDLDSPKTYSLDHKIPISQGGDNSINNLELCSKQINQCKSNLTPEQFIEVCKKVLEYQGYKISK